MKQNRYILKTSLNKSSFIDAINHVHNMNIQLPKTNIENYSNARILSVHEYTACLITKNANHYEYIFNEHTNEVSVLTKASKIDFKFYDYLLLNHYIKEEIITLGLHPLEVTKDNIHNIMDYIMNIATLPIVYLYNYHEVLPVELFENASVIRNDDKEIHEYLCNQYNIQKHAIFFSNESIRPLNRLSDSINIILERYTMQKVYPTMLSVVELYNILIKEQLLELEDAGLDIMETNEHIVDSLKEKIEKMKEKIEKVQQQNIYLKSRLELYDDDAQLPLVYQSKEPEFYDGEQKDMILYLLKKVKERSLDIEEKKIIQEILDENPEVGIRAKNLSQIDNILTNANVGGLSSREVNQLKEYGIYVDEKIKDKDKAYLYGDKRYMFSIHKTNSDINWGKQLYRDIKGQGY